MAFISRRRGIKWSSESTVEQITTKEPINAIDEPTNTIVLTAADSGCFIDTRFLITGPIDWAFAGYRSTTVPNSVTFTHLIDSRTLTPLDVDDHGTTTTLPNGLTLECGSMINPETGILSPYEEIWQDEEYTDALFLKNISGTIWQARVGRSQVALGRTHGTFWAWQAEQSVDGQSWAIVHSTAERSVDYLPSGEGWCKGDTVDWNGDTWTVLEYIK